MWRQLQALLDRAVADQVAPAVGCAAMLDGTSWPVLMAGNAGSGTFFDLASITKIFTTITALALVDDGVLDLDVPVAHHLQEYAKDAKPHVTLRHLLTHTSGLPSAWSGWRGPLARRQDFSRSGLLADVLAMELEVPPGTRFAYSCAGFNTVMALTERATGSPWAELVRHKVLAKLATTELTGTPRPEQCAPTEFQPDLGRGLVRGVVHDEAAWSLGGLSGNAGMFATAAGLRVFGAALLAGLPGILSPALAAEMWRSQLPTVFGTHFPAGAPAFGHGLGLRINQQPWMGTAGIDARGHGGFTGTSLLVDRSRGVVVVLLSNRVNPSRTGDDATALRTAVSNVVYCFAL